MIILKNETLQENEKDHTILKYAAEKYLTSLSIWSIYFSFQISTLPYLKIQHFFWQTEPMKIHQFK